MFLLSTLITKRFSQVKKSSDSWRCSLFAAQAQVQKNKAKGKKQSTVCEDAQWV